MFTFSFFLFILVVPGIEFRASCMLGKHSATELHLQPRINIFFKLTFKKNHLRRFLLKCFLVSELSNFFRKLFTPTIKHQYRCHSLILYTFQHYCIIELFFFSINTTKFWKENITISFNFWTWLLSWFFKWTDVYREIFSLHSGICTLESWILIIFK